MLYIPLQSFAICCAKIDWSYQKSHILHNSILIFLFHKNELLKIMLQNFLFRPYKKYSEIHHFCTSNNTTQLQLSNRNSYSLCAQLGVCKHNDSRSAHIRRILCALCSRNANKTYSKNNIPQFAIKE